MKIIEAMKELKLIEKKMATNQQNITKYASKLSSEMPFFGSEDEQKKEVKALLQSNTDLMERYLTIKRRIELTNLATTIEIGGKKYSVADALVLKRKLAKQMIATYNALNDNSATMRQRGAQSFDGKQITIQRLYDERDKNENLSEWYEIESNLDSRLEVIAAITDLVEG